MDIWAWLNNQLLKMQWLSDLVKMLVEDVFGLSMQSRWGASLHFFIYDVLKIFILLAVLIFTVSWVQSYFPPERTRKILGGMQGFKANLTGALMGTITPFCSCSSIPLFIGFSSAGLPLGVTFSFLISSPLVDLASVILLASIFNWSIAIAYVAVGIVLAVIGGTLISKANMSRYVESFVLHSPVLDIPQAKLSPKDRFDYATAQVGDIFRRVWFYVLLGVGIGAAIHNWVPQAWVTSVLGQDNWWSVFVATLMGVPMYADIFGTLPVAEALVGKGVGLGTALAFMMSVTALSLPSLIMLKKVIKLPLLLFFLVIVVCGIIVIGFLFNAFSYLLI
ncbi:permease [Rheinheimera sp. 4Y26]|uniref:permease n=1 Tax=Rheinheimera sp. 4Y26 TaxID=2977811 RepID=UPI0021B0E906|nr:permease [Rheinheimera sp. 4Y26]MCT6701231.1 permease [Rheinheimera sp. 4Y26]